MILRSFFLATFLLSSAASANVPEWQPEFEQYIDGLVEEFQIPNLAIAVTDENGNLLQLTRGMRDRERGLPVTSHTRFAIGSTTKAFTGILLAELASQSRLSLDAPVQEIIPGFRVADEAVSRILTLRDLAGHWTGAGRHDLAWYHRGLTREQVLALVPFLDQSEAPRTKFIYNNWMWTMAGHAAEIVTGLSWEDLIQERIFAPLGMTESSSSLEEMKRTEDFSLAYASSGGKIEQLPFLDLKEVNPAGGIYSNLEDMTKWVRFHLNRGQVNGRQVMPQAALEDSHRQYTKLGEKTGYGLGWISLPFFGGQLFTHDGGVDGFLTNVSFLPEKKIGVVVLMGATGFSPQDIAFWLYARINGGKAIDFVREEVKQAQAELEKNKKKFPDPEPVALDRAVTDYVGAFCHPLYGRALISADATGAALHVKMNAIESDIYPSAPLSFAIKGLFERMKYLNFQQGEGKITALEWSIEGSKATPERFQRCDI